jgi:hypothetical protein
VAILDVTFDADVAAAVRLLLTLARCERCNVINSTVNWHRAATAYADPEENRPLLLCNACAEEYYEYWNEQWREYYSGQGVYVRPVVKA